MKIDKDKYVRDRAAVILKEHLDAVLRFYDLRLRGGSTDRAARGWVRRWSKSATEAFVWLIDSAHGFSTHAELAESFWDDGSTSSASRSFMKRFRDRRFRCVTSTGEEKVIDPIRWGRDAFFSPHGIAVALSMRGISPSMRDQVLATQALAHSVTANLRGVVEQVMDDASASDEKKVAALAILKSWGAEPKEKPTQLGLLSTGTDGE